MHYNPTSGEEPLKWLDTEQNSGESDECSGEDFGTVYRVGKISTCPIRVELEVEGQPFMMEVDTGAAVSLISECQLQQPRAEPKMTSVVLRTYISEQIPVVGEVRVTALLKKGCSHYTLLEDG